MNLPLYLLTNRAGPYNSGAFPVTSNGWTPIECSSETEAVRELLQLKRRDTDYYVTWLLSLLRLFPDALLQFKPDEVDYDLTAVPLEMPSTFNGSLRSVGGQPPNVAWRSAEWPPAEKMEITREGTRVIIQYGSRTLEAACRVSGHAVYVDWPAELGVSGRIEWQDLALPFTLAAKPHIVLEVLASTLASHAEVQHMLARHGLATSFSETKLKARAIAIVLHALMLSTQNGQ